MSRWVVLSFGLLVAVVDMCQAKLPDWPGITQIGESPRVYTLPNFLSEIEIESILTKADGGWERVSKTHSTLMLEGWPSLSLSEVMQTVDRRIASLTGVDLQDIEEGYIQSYSAGFGMHNLHMDQNPSNMNPARIVTLLIFLSDQPFGSGHTVFPLSPNPDEQAQLERRDKCVEKLQPIAKRYGDGDGADWCNDVLSAKVRTDITNHWQEILEGESLSTREFYRGSQLHSIGQEMCKRGFGFQPKRGDAIMFIAPEESDESETIRAVHGSCFLHEDAPIKNVLVKIGCSGKVRDVSHFVHKDEL